LLIVANLSKREGEILQLLANDMTNGEIAAALGISSRTVENLRGRLYAKLAVKTGGGAVAKGLKLGLIHLQ
jgi:DNA-binding CsgD family transcriptional regulator